MWNPYCIQKNIGREYYVPQWWLKMKGGLTNIHDENLSAMWVATSVKQLTICLRKLTIRLSKLKPFLKTVLHEKLKNIFSANIFSFQRFHKNLSRLEMFWSKNHNKAGLCITVKVLKGNYRLTKYSIMLIAHMDAYWAAASVAANTAPLSLLFITLYQNRTYFPNCSCV